MLEKGEMLARKIQMQQNLQKQKPAPEEPPPPPVNYPIPPRNHPKPNLQPQQKNPNQYLSHSPEPSPQLHYACLDLNPPNPERKFQVNADFSPERRQYTKITLQSHTPEKPAMPHNNGDAPPPRPAKSAHLKKPAKPNDGIDSIMPFAEPDINHLPMQNLNINNLYKGNSHQDPYREPPQYNMNIAKNSEPVHQRNISFEENRNFRKTSPDKFVNPGPSTSGASKFYNYDDEDEELGATALNISNGSDDIMPIPMPSTSSGHTRTFNEKIERLQALKVAGLSVDEIREIDRRIDQEKQDEVSLETL